MADRYWRYRRTVPEVGEALELRERQLLLILELAGAGVSTQDLSRRSGIGEDQVDELLSGLEVCARPAPGAWGLAARARARLAASDDDARRELRTIERTLRAQTRAVGRTRRSEALDLLAQAELRLGTWDIEGARRIIDRHGLSLHRLLALLPAGERDLARARFMLLDATTLMNAGEAGKAIAAFGRWRKLGAMRRLPAAASVRLLATISAAYRMTPGGAVQAAQVLDEADAILAANPIEPAARRWLQRWMSCIRASPLTLLEQHDRAAAALERATDQLDGQLDDVAEVELYRVRTLLARGRREEARARFEAIAPRARAASQWVQGWLYRYQADVIAGGRPVDVTGRERSADVLHACLQGWIRCRGFGFQQRLLLARVAVARPDDRDVEQALAAAPDHDRPVVAGAMADLRRHVAALHRRRHGRRPSECSCAAAGLGPAIVHALDLHEAEALRHLT